MQIRALLTFVELARSASIREAARRANTVPMAISRQIDHLEHFFRTELIDRTASGIRLTDAGRVLAERAQRLVTEIGSIRAEIDDLRGLKRGHVSVVAGGAVVAGLLVPVLCELNLRYPGLRFLVRTASTPAVVAAIENGTADVGITLFSPATANDMICHRVRIDHAVIVSPEHTLSSLEAATLKQVSEHPMALPDGTFGVRQDLDRVARSMSIRLDPVFTTGALDVQKELALRGAAALILPPLCCGPEIAANQLKAIPLAACSTITTSLDLYRTPDRPMPFAAQALLDAVTDYMTRLQTSCA